MYVAEYYINIINYGISNNTFDNGMKLADITHIHKKDEKMDKKNYCPATRLRFSNELYKIGEYAIKNLSQYLCIRKDIMFNML